MTDEASTPSADDVAMWMLSEVKSGPFGELAQMDAVYEIEKRFGASFIYENERGNPAIAAAVLKSFAKVSGNDVVWSRASKSWRKRQPYDDPGRNQSD